MVLVALASLAVTSCQKPAPNLGHQCPYSKCPYKGLKEFTGVIITGETVVDHTQDSTDTYCIDRVHFDHPTWTYDQCEELLFSY